MKVLTPYDLHELNLPQPDPDKATQFYVAVGIPDRDKAIFAVLMAVNHQEFSGKTTKKLQLLRCCLWEGKTSISIYSRASKLEVSFDGVVWI